MTSGDEHVLFIVKMFIWRLFLLPTRGATTYMRMKNSQFVRHFNVCTPGEIDVFLGAGASISSGMPTSEDLIWCFKREIYCTENGVSPDRFKDLKSAYNRQILQEYFNDDKRYPILGAHEEYSFYFAECYNTYLARKNFIDALVESKNPATGYLCLANLILSGKIKNVWTTNFDQLVETAVQTLDSTFPLNVCSSANAESFSRLNPRYSCVYKLHGDYRYDKLQNTTDELKSLEEKLKTQFFNSLIGKGLLVIGYSGSDDSVMKFFEEKIDEPGFLSKGLFWAVLKGSAVPERVTRLIEKFNNVGKKSFIVEIEDFDSLFYQIYTLIGNPCELIDKNKIIANQSSELTFRLPEVKIFIKLNAFQVKAIPHCNVFETDITSWADLREIKGDLIAGLYRHRIYSLADTDALQLQFGKHIRSSIIRIDGNEEICYQNQTYIGLLYDLIAKVLINNKGLIKYRRNKFYNPATQNIGNGIIRYEAIEICIECVSNQCFLLLYPTYHFVDVDGKDIDIARYKVLLNYAQNIHNADYDAYLKEWQKKLLTERRMVFADGEFSLEFIVPSVSCGGNNRLSEWVKRPAYCAVEPEMVFSCDNDQERTINQLKGLVKYGPLDYSFDKSSKENNPIKLGVIAPTEYIDSILGHLNSLNESIANTGKDRFLPHYEGFASVFKKALIVPQKGSKLCLTYDTSFVGKYSAKDFCDFLKSIIDKFAQNRMYYDVLVIYIPRRFQKYRQEQSTLSDFDLHDALKLYATDQDVTLQFIEEKSVVATDKCKVMWGLSTAIYAKSAMGTLWRPYVMNTDTAYVGISYAISYVKGTCIGCSQLFDSTGTGMRLLLRKIESPHYAGKSNPYMGQEEARKMMCDLREQYYHCHPTSQLNRIVVYKTTPFMKDEIKGIAQAFQGLRDIELIQIQSFNRWRGLKYGVNYLDGPEGFPISRGTVIHLDNKSFLLWTHGNVRHSDLGNMNYYKNGRGIPGPLYVKRYAGNSSGEELVNEIMMLTKMNWNSGDGLYKVLPVTLDFAKVLSRMSKQDEVIYNKAYDFRYFM